MVKTMMTTAKSTINMRTGTPTTEQGQMPFQTYISPIFWWKSYPGMVLDLTHESLK